MFFMWFLLLTAQLKPKHPSMKTLRILLDVSTSMRALQDNGRSIFQNVTTALGTGVVAEVIDECRTAGEQLSLEFSTFNGALTPNAIPPVLVEACTDDEHGRQVVASITSSLQQLAIGGTTALYDSVRTTALDLARAISEGDSRESAVLLLVTDGDDTSSEHSRAAMMSALAEAHGVTFIARGCDDVSIETQQLMQHPTGDNDLAPPVFFSRQRSESVNSSMRSASNATSYALLGERGQSPVTCMPQMPFASPTIPPIPPPPSLRRR